jgi:hypothetical protein
MSQLQMSLGLKLEDSAGASHAEILQIFGAKIPNIQFAQRNVRKSILLNHNVLISSQIVVYQISQKVVKLIWHLLMLT